MSEMMKVPDGWEVLKLSDIGNIITGNTPSTDVEEYYNGNIPFIGPVDFDGQKYISEIEKTVSNEGLKCSREIPKDTIMTVCIGSTIGKLALSTKISCTNQQVNSLVCNKKYVSEFIYYSMLQFLQRQLDVEAGLQAVPIVNKSSFSNLILLAPKEKKEQEKIAKILSTLDKSIESTNRLIEKEKHIKTALMQELLTNGIDQNGQIRTSATHTYKPSQLGLISDEWEVVSLIDVTDKNDRYSFTGGPFGSDLKSSDYVDQGVRVIQLQNIGDGEFKNNDFVYTSEQKAQELFSCQIFPNEIIMSKMGDPVGRACLIPNIEEKFVMCSDGIRIKVELNRFDNYFIFLAINNTDFRNLIERVALGSTRKRIGLIELKTLKLKIPKFEEQKQIAKILTTQDKKIQTEETTLAKLKELKKGLMNDLLSGKVRVKV